MVSGTEDVGTREGIKNISGAVSFSQITFYGAHDCLLKKTIVQFISVPMFLQIPKLRNR